MTTYLIAGAAGFIGTNFLHYLLENYPQERILAVDNLSFAGNNDNIDALGDAITFIEADIVDFKAMSKIYEQYRPDYVVNFAAESHNDRAIINPSLFMRSNALGAQSLVEASRQFPVRKHVHVSTIEVYGELPPGVPSFTEASPLNAKTPYSAAKAAGDHIIRSYMHTYPQMRIALTHCANNYGPWQMPEKLIPLAITHLLRGKKAPIYGDGSHLRDWLHVYDHCRAIDAVINAEQKTIPPEAPWRPELLPIYDISAGNELSNKEIVERIANLLGLSDAIEYVADRPNHDRRYLIDPSKIRRELNWKPVCDFTDGLTGVVQWYIDNQAWWQAIEQRTGELRLHWN